MGHGPNTNQLDFGDDLDHIRFMIPIREFFKDMSQIILIQFYSTGGYTSLGGGLCCLIS